MPEPAESLTPATPEDLADALAFALRFEGRRRTRNADEIMAGIVAKRLVEHLQRAGFVVMKCPPEIGAQRSGADLKSRAPRSPRGLRADRLLHKASKATSIIVVVWHKTCLSRRCEIYFDDVGCALAKLLGRMGSMLH